MKRILLILVCLGFAGNASAEKSCDGQGKDYYGSKYYKKCHCPTFSYPDVVTAMKPLGIEVESNWVACSTFEGGEWCVCGVRLSWAEQPADKQACEARKKEVKALADEIIKEKKNFGVSMPLICR